MASFRALIESQQFGAGLTAGAVCAFLVVMATSIRGRLGRPARDPLLDSRAASGVPRPPRPSIPGMLGGAFVVATLVATRWLGPDVGGATVSSRVVVALLLLWLAGTLAARVRRGRGLAGGLLAIPGGVLLASSVAGSRPWAAALLIVGPAIAGTGTADLDERLGSSGTAALAFAVALGGMYATVPDTELVRSGLGAATWITLLAWPFAVGRIGRGGAYGASGLFLWMALVAGAGRPGSTIGAAACLGMLIVEPLGRLLARPVPMRPTRPGITPPALIIAAQCALALYFSRVAGFQVLASHAALMALPALVAAVIVTIAVARTGTRARR